MKIEYRSSRPICGLARLVLALVLPGIAPTGSVLAGGVVPGDPSYEQIHLVVDDANAYSPMADRLLMIQVAKLIASDAEADDQFGYAVAVSGDTVVVGTPDNRRSGTTSGSAYIFEHNENGADEWGQVKKLTASDAAAGDAFGFAVAISGDTAVVGALCNISPSPCPGSAYVFERNQGGADNWGEVKKLTGSAVGDLFGTAVSISGDTLTVGAPRNSDAGTWAGSAYVFERNQGGADNWGEVKKLTGSAAGDQFGYAVTISDDTLVVGAPENDDAGYGAGTVYVFERNQDGANAWGQVKKLIASDAAANDMFGYAVSVSGSALVVGAPYKENAYVFERNKNGADAWGEVKKLVASDATTLNHFGFSVAASGDALVVGAYGNASAGEHTGAAYIFERNGGGAGQWGEVKKVIASNPAAENFFGSAVAISGDILVAGAWGNDDAGTDSGSAYVFGRAIGIYLPLVGRGFK